MTKPRSMIFNVPLFTSGFRVFFAASSLAALLLLVGWARLYRGEWSQDLYFGPTLWHGHEMILGYIVAVAAGLLLTWIKQRTGQAPLRADGLAGMVLLWCYGRVAPFYEDDLPAVLIAGLDLAFLPLLIYYAAKPLIRGRDLLGLACLLPLGFLMIGNVLIHAERLGWTTASAAAGLQWAWQTWVLVIVMLAGTALPLFIERGIPGARVLRYPWLDHTAIASSLLVFIWQDVSPRGTGLALVALATALVHGWRLRIWYQRPLWHVPLLWVLLIAYAWLVVGWLLTASTAWGFATAPLALHAFTVGSLGVTTLGLMARVALQQTGRGLRVSTLMAGGFLLINGATLTLVAFPLLGWSSAVVFHGALYCWLAAFALFMAHYAPILTAETLAH